MSVSSAQLVERLPNETNETFVKRVFNRTDFAHPILEVKEKGWGWEDTAKVIICFYDDDGIVGQLLIPTSSSQYQKVLIDTLHDEDAGTWEQHIESVFFANADDDRERELVVMSTLKPRDHRGAELAADGTYYVTDIYDNPNLQHISKRLQRLELSDLFSMSFDGKTYDKASGLIIKIEINPFKDVDSIRRALKQLGY